MRQFQSSMMTNTDERHVLHSTGIDSPNVVWTALRMNFSRGAAPGSAVE